MSQRRPALPRILGYLVLIAALGSSILLWLDIIGAVDARTLFMPIFVSLGLAPESPSMSNPGELFLENERIQKEREEIQLRTEELNERENALALRQNELDTKDSTLTDMEKNLAERENALQISQNQYDNKKANLDQVSRYLTGMPPADAVKILAAMNDQDLIDVLRATEAIAQNEGEQSLVSFWLSLISKLGDEGATRAAEIQIKMVRRPD